MKKKTLRKEVNINQIKLWFDNPRYFDNPNHIRPTDERDAIIKLFKVVGNEKMLNIANDICNEGLNDFELPILVQDKENDELYTSYEGNRRIVCVKCIINPMLIKGLKIDEVNVYDKFLNMHNNFGHEIDSNVFSSIKDEEDAKKIVDKLHSKKNVPGLNREQWPPMSKDVDLENKTNKKPTALKITEALKTHLHLDINKKIDYTNISRFFDKKKIKEIFNEYENMTLEDSKKINIIIDEANKKVKKDREGFSRLFNTNEKVWTFLKELQRNNVLEIEGLKFKSNIGIKKTKRITNYQKTKYAEIISKQDTYIQLLNQVELNKKNYFTGGLSQAIKEIINMLELFKTKKYSMDDFNVSYHALIRVFAEISVLYSMKQHYGEEGFYSKIKPHILNSSQQTQSIAGLIKNIQNKPILTAFGEVIMKKINIQSFEEILMKFKEINEHIHNPKLKISENTTEKALDYFIEMINE